MNETPVLDREHLEIRSLILQLAAALDRVDRCDLPRDDDLRWMRMQRALAVLTEDRDQRAERVQMIFSREFEDSWREHLGVPTTRII